MVGGELLSRARSALARAERPPQPGQATRPAACPPSSTTAILSVPAVGLVAPVVQGDGDAQLAVAVGHVPTSAWPGGPGTAVLAAHDVTWFHRIGSLHPGAVIEYRTGCRSITYRVTSSAVVRAGTSVPDVPGQLALVTCWPLDALWYTGSRLLVLATQTGGSSNAPGTLRIPTAAPPPPLAVAPALRALDTLAANPTPLGALAVSGTPDPTWTESPAPLADAAAAQDLYFATLRAAVAADAAEWWASAPGVAPLAAKPLDRATVVGFGESLGTTLDVAGNRLVAAEIHVGLVLSGGPAPGPWSVTVDEGVVDGSLAVTSWHMVASR